MDKHPTVADSIRSLESFGSDLKDFLTRFTDTSLFRRLPPKGAKADAEKRLFEGRYLLRPCGTEFREENCGVMALELFDLLKKHLPEREKALVRIQNIFVEGKVGTHEFLEAVFSNLGNRIIKLVRQHDLEEDLTTFFAVLLARPIRQAAAKHLTADVDLSKWTCGYCPVCGHWPSFSHIEGNEGHRTLWCLHCGVRWQFPRITCAYCLNTDHEKLEIITPLGEEAYRAQVCLQCRRYLKEIRSKESADELDFDTLYLGTTGLDFAVRKEGYIQESPLTVRYDDPDGNELLMYRQDSKPRRDADDDAP